MNYENLKAWVHWAKIEKDADEDKILMAKTIDKVIAVVEAAKDLIEKNHKYKSIETDLEFKKSWNSLYISVKELEE